MDTPGGGRAPHEHGATLHAVSAAVLAVTRHLSVREVFQVIVRAAAQLLDARYAALGVPDDEGSFAEFVVEGVTDAQWDAIGPLPRQHGMLAVMLREGTAQRLPTSARNRVRGLADGPPDAQGLPRRARSADGDEVLGIIFLANKRVARRLHRRTTRSCSRCSPRTRRSPSPTPGCTSGPRADHHGGAQPAGPRAARRGRAEALLALG